jgi:cytochrome c-type biogenesis protein CcmH
MRSGLGWRGALLAARLLAGLLPGLLLLPGLPSAGLMVSLPGPAGLLPAGIVVAGWLAGAPAFAVEPREKLANPELEARAEAIGRTLRCLVCQNESIEESGADLAHDLRMLLRQRLVAGDSNAQAIQYIVARYGQFVLLRPPVEPATWVLWYGPGALLVVAGLSMVIWLRRRPQPGTPTAAPPLTAAERQRLDDLLRETDR